MLLKLLKYRAEILLAIVLAAMLLLGLMPKIPQDQAYHVFADRRDFFAIPNFLNLVSNLAYVLVGLPGLASVWRGRRSQQAATATMLYALFFLGVIFTGFASACYHVAPDNTSLAWDRLAMAVAFMALFSIVMHERISAKWGMRLAAPLIVLGMLSVLYWLYTESMQQGDLRLYVLVQFLPLILLPFILLLYQPVYGGDRYYWLMMLCYLLAKLAEHFDFGIMNISGEIVSGHTLKHLLSALAAWFMVLMYSRYRLNRPWQNSARPDREV